MEYVSVILCRNCGSRYVEVNEWTQDKKAVFHCRTCGKKEIVEWFTLGRCQVTQTELQKARDTKAKPGKYER
ncbi:MAG: hypothetical protein GYA16_01395 [Spirochaetes bacterium]|nr:hypothetical protein [Spirochaetota bacterium]NMB63502.1 hypothetical protein [Spirochaetota bacterium]HOJ28220.1 hypothetical protein [Spirochaetota bacterium]HOM10402.1 hypothetical protein [Spirochaetota bacterium]HPP50227.1 hypothetical protein [Spirochaetota bacterium]